MNKTSRKFPQLAFEESDRALTSRKVFSFFFFIFLSQHIRSQWKTREKKSITVALATYVILNIKLTNSDSALFNTVLYHQSLYLCRSNFMNNMHKDN